MTKIGSSERSLLLKITEKTAVVAHAYDPSSWERGAGQSGSRSSSCKASVLSQCTKVRSEEECLLGFILPALWTPWGRLQTCVTGPSFPLGSLTAQISLLSISQVGGFN